MNTPIWIRWTTLLLFYVVLYGIQAARLPSMSTVGVVVGGTAFGLGVSVVLFSIGWVLMRLFGKRVQHPGQKLFEVSVAVLALLFVSELIDLSMPKS